jgi:hypothetical protein
MACALKSFLGRDVWKRFRKLSQQFVCADSRGDDVLSGEYTPVGIKQIEFISHLLETFTFSSGIVTAVKIRRPE